MCVNEVFLCVCVCMCVCVCVWLYNGIKDGIIILILCKSLCVFDLLKMVASFYS